MGFTTQGEKMKTFRMVCGTDRTDSRFKIISTRGMQRVQVKTNGVVRRFQLTPQRIGDLQKIQRATLNDPVRRSHLVHVYCDLMHDRNHAHGATRTITDEVMEQLNPLFAVLRGE